MTIPEYYRWLLTDEKFGMCNFLSDNIPATQGVCLVRQYIEAEVRSWDSDAFPVVPDCKWHEIETSLYQLRGQICDFFHPCQADYIAAQAFDVALYIAQGIIEVPSWDWVGEQASIAYASYHLEFNHPEHYETEIILGQSRRVASASWRQGYDDARMFALKAIRTICAE